MQASVPSAVQAPSGRRLLIVTSGAIAACTFLATMLALTGFEATGISRRLTEALFLGAAAVFVGAGVLRISHWRIAGDCRSALMGTALLVLGAVAIPMSGVAAALAPSQAGLHETLTRGVSVLVVLSLVVRALNAPPFNQRLRAARVLCVALALALTGFAAIVVLGRLSSEWIAADTRGHTVVGLVIASSWAAVAVLAWSRGKVEPWAARVAPLLGGMAVVSILRTVSIHQLDSFRIAAGLLVGVIAGLAAHSAVMDLARTTDHGQRHLNALEEALARARELAGNQNAWREELAHDAHNALAGLRAALLTLERYGASLDGPTSEQLRTAALEEVGHLEHLIDRTEQDQPVDFDITDVVVSTVATRIATGLDVRLGSVAGRAHGRPGDLATVLQNLLVNADLHAPASPVEVSSTQVADRVEIRVADYGPGIPDEAASRVFERGQRGPHSRGTGLGLYVARELMRAQDGDLRLVKHAGGCTFVLSLPLAKPAPAPSAVPAQRQNNPWTARPVLELL